MNNKNMKSQRLFGEARRGMRALFRSGLQNTIFCCICQEVKQKYFTIMFLKETLLIRAMSIHSKAWTDLKLSVLSADLSNSKITATLHNY